MRVCLCVYVYRRVKIVRGRVKRKVRRGSAPQGTDRGLSAQASALRAQAATSW